MDNKKMEMLFGAVLFVFLGVVIVVCKEYDSYIKNESKQKVSSLSNIVRQKNEKIKALYDQLAVTAKENDDLKNTLTETRNGLESLSKKLVQPVVPAADVPVPAAQAAVDASKTPDASATAAKPAAQ